MNITELCVNCKQNNSCTMCWKTSKKKCPHFIQKTNADCIRAMSDEELAETLALLQTNFAVLLLEKLECTTEETAACLEETKKEFLEWLKQPAE